MSRRVLVIASPGEIEQPLRDAVNLVSSEAITETRSPEDIPFGIPDVSWDLILTTPTQLKPLLSSVRGLALEEAAHSQDELLGMLLHELRTPLTPIMAWAQLLKRANALDRVPHAADAIERNVRSQIAIVEDVLDINRMARGALKLDRRHADLRQLVQKAIATARAAAEEKRTALVASSELVGPLTAEADVPRLQQAVTYLLLNAVRFTPSNGTVTSALCRETGSAVLTVSDEGPPIDEPTAPPAFQLGRARELGARNSSAATIQLAVACGIVELHKGSVDATNGPGGVRVTLRIPLVERVTRR